MHRLEKLLPAGFIGKAYFQSKEGLEILASKTLRNVWVVSRGCCHYKKIEIGNLPENKLKSFIITNLPLISPFKNSGYWFRRQSKNLHLWIWDKSLQQDFAKDHALDLNHFLVVPTSCFSGKEEGSEIYKESSGECFGQVWKDGELLGDSWWKSIPTQKDWETFLLGLGVDVSPVSLGSSLSYEEYAPWTALKNFVLSSRRLEFLVAISLALIFVLVFSFQSSTTLRSTYLISTLKSEVKNLKERTADLVAKKEKAERALYELNELRVLRADGQLALINEVSNALPASAKKILRWDYRGDNALVLILEVDNPDIEAYVKSLERLSRVSGVEITAATGSQLKLEIGIR